MSSFFDDLTDKLQARAPRGMNLKAVAVGGLLAASLALGASQAGAQQTTSELPAYMKEAAAELFGHEPEVVESASSMSEVIQAQLRGDTNTWIRGLGPSGIPSDEQMERFRRHHADLVSALEQHGHQLAVLDVVESWVSLGTRVGMEQRFRGEALEWFKRLNIRDARINEAYRQQAETYKEDLVVRHADAVTLAHQGAIENELVQVTERATRYKDGTLNDLAHGVSKALRSPVRKGSRRLRAEAMALDFELQELKGRIKQARKLFDSEQLVIEENAPDLDALEAVQAVSQKLTGPTTRGGLSRK